MWRIGIHESGREWRSLHAGVRIFGEMVLMNNFFIVQDMSNKAEYANVSTA
jgi:hypothetical protein